MRKIPFAGIEITSQRVRGYMVPLSYRGDRLDQEDGDFRGPTRDFTLEHIALVPNVRKHNLIYTKGLTRVFDEPMRIYPTVVAIRPRRGGKPLIFRPLRRENGLLEIRVRRINHTKIRTAKPSASSSLVRAKRNRRDIMEFHRVLGDPSREIRGKRLVWQAYN